MRRFLTAFAIAIILFACNSAEKAFNRGQYDVAITKAIKKLRKKPADIKHLQIVEDAFGRVVENDNRRLDYLRKEGNPASFDQMFGIYTRMKSRQSQIRSLPNPPANITYVNYDNEIINMKKKAAEFLYAHALTLLDKNDRGKARQAYSELTKVKGYYSDFKEVDKKLIEAKLLGTNNVIFSMENKTGVPLPPAFEQDLKKISIASMNQNWINYYNVKQQGLYYDYSIMVNMKIIDVSPELVNEKEFFEQREIPDGFDYVLDKNGNVMRDSLGNDIKLPKTKIITCTVQQTTQKKTARISGTVDYIDNRTSELLKSEPITSDAFFQHLSATAIGDLNALKPATKKTIGLKPMPFPNDFALLLQASTTLKDMIKNIIFNNKMLLN